MKRLVNSTIAPVALAILLSGLASAKFELESVTLHSDALGEPVELAPEEVAALGWDMMRMDLLWPGPEGAHSKATLLVKFEGSSFGHTYEYYRAESTGYLFDPNGGTGTSWWRLSPGMTVLLDRHLSPPASGSTAMLFGQPLQWILLTMTGVLAITAVAGVLILSVNRRRGFHGLPARS